jgi:hypothetical protein
VVMSYDRRVPEALLAVLRPGGFAHSLVEFGASGMWALDLQLRGLGEVKKQHRATLYVGTTKAMDLHLRGGRFALSASRPYATQANRWDSAWGQPHDAKWLADRWPAVEVYLQRVIEQVVAGGRYVKEGMVQSAIGRFPSAGFTVLDREAVVSFGSQPEKDACIAELSARWLGALHRPDPPAWWKTRPDRLGDECDALAGVLACDGCGSAARRVLRQPGSGAADRRLVHLHAAGQRRMADVRLLVEHRLPGCRPVSKQLSGCAQLALAALCSGSTGAGDSPALRPGVGSRFCRRDRQGYGARVRQFLRFRLRLVRRTEKVRQRRPESQHNYGHAAHGDHDDCRGAVRVRRRHEMERDLPEHAERQSTDGRPAGEPLPAAGHRPVRRARAPCGR